MHCRLNWKFRTAAAAAMSEKSKEFVGQSLINHFLPEILFASQLHTAERQCVASLPFFLRCGQRKFTIFPDTIAYELMMWVCVCTCMFNIALHRHSLHDYHRKNKSASHKIICQLSASPFVCLHFGGLILVWRHFFLLLLLPLLLFTNFRQTCQQMATTSNLRKKKRERIKWVNGWITYFAKPIT